MTLRGGATLIEVIVAIFVVGLLASLIVPATLAARNAARKAQCVGNLKQLGISVSNYVAQSNVYPPGANGRRAYSMHAMLLPYIGQPELYNSVNFSIGMLTREGRSAVLTARNQVVSLFLCPSDSGVGRHDSAPTNYAGNAGLPLQRMLENGVFYAGDSPTVSPANIKDGASSTAMMGEWIMGSGASTRLDDIRSAIFSTSMLVRMQDGLDVLVSECAKAASDSNSNYGTTKGSQWISGSLGDSLYNHADVLNGMTCTNQTLVQDGAWTTGSNHGGGTNMLFVDGGVRFLRTGMSVNVYRALGTRNGGEHIGDHY
jgi:prepilin-type processing-associated H-X9-DG protein